LYKIVTHKQCLMNLDPDLEHIKRKNYFPVPQVNILCILYHEVHDRQPMSSKTESCGCLITTSSCFIKILLTIINKEDDDKHLKWERLAPETEEVNRAHVSDISRAPVRAFEERTIADREGMNQRRREKENDSAFLLPVPSLALSESPSMERLFNFCRRSPTWRLPSLSARDRPAISLM
jgi:hypothetical protein